jgi:hypothetical protein
MTDIEIDKALALAIGWCEDQIVVGGALFIEFNVDDFGYEFRSFSHKDWNVIGPIAARYDCFPKKDCRGDWVNTRYQHTTTPQRAIALDVIGRAKK